MKEVIGILTIALFVVGLMVTGSLSSNTVIVIPGENGCREEITDNRHVFDTDTIDRVTICETRSN